MSETQELGVTTITIAFDDGKADLGADGEFFVTPDAGHESVLLNDRRLALIKRVSEAEVEP